MLLASPGKWPLTRFDPTGGYGKSGYFRAGPIAVSVPPLSWHRWRIDADSLDPAAGVQLFSMVAFPGPNPPPGGPEDNSFPESSDWAALPRNQLDVTILDDDARAALRGLPTPSGQVEPDDAPREVWIWLGGRLEGDGRVSPVLRQMRIDVAPGSSLRYLPRIYREGSILAPLPTATPAAMFQHRLERLQSRLLLDLWLAAIDAEARPDRRGAGRAAPAVRPGRRADRRTPLAGELARLRLAGDLARGRRAALPRRSVRPGPDPRHDRGPAALSQDLRRSRCLGRGAFGAQRCAPLVLGQTSTLGFDTVLAPAPAYGAVLASTATLDHSHILDPSDGGVPLFGDVAHCFCVQVHAAQVAVPRT